jgi:hypothetical protein
MSQRNLTKYAEIGRRVREIPAEKTRPSHQWEELVHKMCVSNDAGLHEIGIKEFGELQHRLPKNN